MTNNRNQPNPSHLARVFASPQCSALPHTNCCWIYPAGLAAWATRTTVALLTVFVTLWVLVFAAAPQARGDTQVAASAEIDDVEMAVESASAGDLVLIPSGSAVWTRGLSLNKAVTLQGAGIDQTTIVNMVNDVNQSAITITLSSSGLTRVTGITLRGNNTGRGIAVGGSVGEYFRVDHVKFIRCNSRAIYAIGDQTGVIDNCTFEGCTKTVDVFGDGSGTASWNRPLTLGTTNCVVIEDCHFQYDNGFDEEVAATTSSGLGGRRVWRYNTWSNFNADLSFFPIIDAHGNQQPVSGQNIANDPPGGTGPHRGTRQLEMYGNSFWAVTGSNCRLTDLRGGTILVFSNNFLGPGMQTTFRLREEDGPTKNNFRTLYPGYDQHRLWFWENYVNGSPITAPSFEYPQDPVFIVSGQNLLWLPHPGYTPLQYPHPLRDEGIPASVEPLLTVSRTRLDFGVVALGSANELTLTVQNAGGGTLPGTASVGTPFSIVAGRDYSLASGEKQNLTVRFNPTVSGETTGELFLTGGGGATVTLKGSAGGSP